MTGPRDFPNLTELELAAIASGINVADGHARYDPTPAQRKIIEQLPDLFAQAAEASPVGLDRDAQAAYLSAVGQHTAGSAAEVLTCYSSSVAMEIFARALAAAGLRRVALIHPTFDNIPDILKGLGMSLVPLDESSVFDQPAGPPPGADVVFITTPNNPTGRTLGEQQLAHWARRCAERGVVLALDTSFRGFDRRAQFDHYAVLAGSGCRYVVIEDTGKLWPTLDLKVGFLVFRRDEPLALRRIYTDILLGVSPLILALVRALADDAGEGGFADLHRLIGANRSIVRSGLPRLSFPDPDSRVSVERIDLGTRVTGTRVAQALRQRGVHALPCRQFHWADPASGERYLRLALGRPGHLVARATQMISDYLAS